MKIKVIKLEFLLVSCLYPKYSKIRKSLILTQIHVIVYFKVGFILNMFFNI